LRCAFFRFARFTAGASFSGEVSCSVTRMPRIAQIAAMSPEGQGALSADLLADMERRQVHPSIRKRLQTSGWQHPMVLPEMVRYYAVGSLGEQWDKPTPQQLLQIAAELGDA